MKLLVLKKGDTALISAEDYLRVSQYDWYSWKHHGNTYIRATLPGNKKILLHRLILNFPAGQVDHINGIGRDNRRDNLRAVGHAPNMQNSMSRGGFSAYKGVSRHRDKWVARITVKARGVYLGIFASETAAALEYDKAAREFYGDFGRYNFPNSDERPALRVAA